MMMIILLFFYKTSNLLFLTKILECFIHMIYLLILLLWMHGLSIIYMFMLIMLINMFILITMIMLTFIWYFDCHIMFASITGPQLNLTYFNPFIFVFQFSLDILDFLKDIFILTSIQQQDNRLFNYWYCTIQSNNRK